MLVTVPRDGFALALGAPFGAAEAGTFVRRNRGLEGCRGAGAPGGAAGDRGAAASAYNAMLGFPEMRLAGLRGLMQAAQADGDKHVYRYWVAVTERNQSVIAKEYFDLPVTFAPGKDRAYATDTIEQITIPRADDKVSGSNFEVLLGFDVTPEMAAFNRDGKRFRVNAGQAAQAQQAGQTQAGQTQTGTTTKQ